MGKRTKNKEKAADVCCIERTGGKALIEIKNGILKEGN